MHGVIAASWLAACLSACATTATDRDLPAPPPAAPPLRASVPMTPSPFVVPLDAATRARLPRQAVEASTHVQAADCEGVALADLLRETGAMPAAPLQGPQLARYVLVTARDGSRVVYSLAEFDPTLGARRVVLVDRCAGKPLDADDGPLRLIAADETRAARSLRQVKSITVIAAP